MVDERSRQSRSRGDPPASTLRKVILRRVSCKGEGTRGNAFLLTDSQKRSIMVCVGYAEARAVGPWLAGQGDPDALDVHTTLVRVLRAFKRKVERVTIPRLRKSIFYGVLTVRGGDEGSIDLDCRPSDGVNVAVRTRAPVYVDEAVVERVVLRGPDGEPLSPKEAEKALGGVGRERERRTFANVSAALRVLEREPGSPGARAALSEIAGWRRMPAPRLKDPSGGIERIAAWAAERKGTPFEGIGLSLIGASHLWKPAPDAESALPYLEKAYRICPANMWIAFDLATAYALLDRADDALSLIRRHELAERYPDFPRFSNFQSLRGKPTPGGAEAPTLFMSGQFGIGIREGDERSASAQVVGPLKVRRMSVARRRRLGEWMGETRLLGIESLWIPADTAEGSRWAILGMEDGGAAGLRQSKSERAVPLCLPTAKASRPPTPEFASRLLRRTGLTLEAVVYLKRTRAGIETRLVVREGDRRAAIGVGSRGGIQLGMASRCPMLMTPGLAEKLMVRDGRGRTLGPDGACRQLAGG